MSKYAVITGASQGLGLELVREGIKRGYIVFALDKNISEELKRLSGEKIYIMNCDISDERQIEICFKKIVAVTDRIDVLLNCAGIWLDRERKHLDDENFDFDAVFKQFEVNAAGTLRMIRSFLPLVRKSTEKAIINISSEAGSIENCYRKGEYGYCMSKAALNMACKLTKNANPELKIYAIHPGWMQTPQGYAGAVEGYLPDQNPADTAVFLFDIVRQNEKGYIFMDYKGKKMEW